MEEFIKKTIQESINAKQSFLETPQNTEDIQNTANLIVQAFKNGNKLLICGNGGSAADAQHISGELVDKFMIERKGLPAIALTTDTSVITAWGNDKDFNEIFERQTEALGKPGDVLVGISTSGNSKNIVKAFNKAKGLNMKTISLTGKDGGEIKQLSDLNINVSHDSTPRIQEVHLVIYHIICELIEAEMFKEPTQEIKSEQGDSKY